ncbi:hypothetical protein [uncultured Megasphaera sp.]|uniref:hypothetical protein n=1 Tax=uncultured Megasphaera sp. TaxID=165188 RepID=UPI002659E91E|nr:hypothetical protein [uncultured Megasphaera sp.]
MANVRDVDMGYQKITVTLKELDGRRVEAGVFADAGTAKDGKTSLADIAYWNEYGVTINVSDKMRKYLHANDIHLSPGKTSIHIPSRPFMRQAADKNMGKWGDTAEKLVKMIAYGMSAQQGLELLGIQAKGDIQDIFTSGSFAANSPATIAKKGSSRPLIDSGSLRDSGVDFRTK